MEDEEKSGNAQTLSTHRIEELEKQIDDPIIEMDVRLKKTYKNMR